VRSSIFKVAVVAPDAIIATLKIYTLRLPTIERKTYKKSYHSPFAQSAIKV
jgi:hypothetical protein